MIEAHFKKLRARDEISSAEEAAIRATVAEEREYRDNFTVARRGAELSESTLLLEGWMGRSKILSDGQRQISEISVPGDFTDLHGFTLKRLDHDVVTLSRCRAAIVPHDRIRPLLDRFPHLARVYWMMTNMDAAIHREWTLSLGRRAALGRMAHLFCELFVRLKVAGLVDGQSYQCPLSQQELSECLGLTAVHVNRTLQELRRRGLIEFQSRRLTILDLPLLQSIAEFDADYLYLEKRPR